MIFDYNVILENLPLYFGGVLVTLKTLRAELRLHALLKPHLGLN